MGSILLRQIDDKLHDAIRHAAALSGRSVEAEIRELLRQRYGQPGADWFAEAAGRRRSRAPFSQVDSAELVRQARDER